MSVRLISSGVYERTIRSALKRRGVTVPVEVANRGGVGLAPEVRAGIRLSFPVCAKELDCR